MLQHVKQSATNNYLLQSGPQALFSLSSRNSENTSLNAGYCGIILNKILRGTINVRMCKGVGVTTSAGCVRKSTLYLEKEHVVQ